MVVVLYFIQIDALVAYQKMGSVIIQPQFSRHACTSQFVVAYLFTCIC